MSSNLYGQIKPKALKKRSHYVLKFLFRRLFETDIIDMELDEFHLDTLTTAMLSTEDPDIRDELCSIISIISEGNVYLLKEEY